MPNPTPHATETPGRDAGETLHETSNPEIGAFSQTEMTAEDQELARSYLAGNLTEEERAMFEERILTDAAFREDIELTHAMREGIRELAKRGELPALMSHGGSFWSRPLFSIAASVAAVVFATTSILLYMRDNTSATGPNVVASLSATTSTAVLRFQLTRGADRTPDVIWRRPADPTLLTLEFDVGIEPAPYYSGVLTSVSERDATRIIAVPHLAPDADGSISIEIHSALLVTGEYQVTLVPQAGDVTNIVTFTYSLRVTD